MTPDDRADLEIGRLFMRAHAAEALAKQLAAEREAGRAKVAAVAKPKRSSRKPVT